MIETIPSEPIASHDVRAVEEKSLNAWAPLRRTLCDGWVLGFSDGYTRRANCVNVLYGGTRPAQEKVDLCEAAYRVRGLVPVFKVTPLALEQDVEVVLSSRGYVREATTLVQTAALEDGEAPRCDIDARRTLDADWMSSYATLKGLSARDAVLTETILRQASGQARFVALHDSGQAVAAGFCAIEGEHVGLFGLVTDPRRRREGFGTQLVAALLRLGYAEGARRAYLQVEAANTVARSMYEKFGFREAYRYWYRVLPAPGTARGGAGEQGAEAGREARSAERAAG